MIYDLRFTREIASLGKGRPVVPPAVAPAVVENYGGQESYGGQVGRCEISDGSESGRFYGYRNGFAVGNVSGAMLKGPFLSGSYRR
jgi:hypothetical protein